MVAPGNGGNDFKCNWKNGAVLSAVSMESKPAGWYRVTMIVTPTTHQQKVQNLSTGEIFLGTAELNGTSTIGESVAFTLFSYGIDGATGAYGSVGMNVSNVKITRNGATIFHLPLSEGHLAVVRDVVSKTAYALGFFTISAGWAKLADFGHYNFKNGFTLYKKASNPNIYVPNDSTGAEIPWTPLLSYVRVANYKGTTTSYNQCESKFKLDDVNPLTDLIVTNATDEQLNGAYQRHGDYLGKSYWYDGQIDVYPYTYTHFFNWDGLRWCWGRDNGQVMFYGNEDVSDPWDVITWTPALGTLPVGDISEPESNALYAADIDHVLFTEGTGVAKEFSITGMDFNYDRGYLYINSDVQETNFMLYGTDKTLTNDLKVLKYVEQIDRVSYDEETGLPNYDEANHAELTE